MDNRLSAFTIDENTTLIEALQKIDKNKQGFVIVIDKNEKVIGVLTDGDVRRSVIRNCELTNSIAAVYSHDPKVIEDKDDFETIADLFKDQAIKFLPILDKHGKLKNIITKSQLHTILLQDIRADLDYDFGSLDTSVVDHEIFYRPWGYYKTTVLNDYYQGKIISVKPHGQLSLQSHDHREEHWIIVHGKGQVQLDDSILSVTSGSSVFIPKGCKHRLINTDEKENLIITEVQIGDYFGEDDINRYDDMYGRV